MKRRWQWKSINVLIIMLCCLFAASQVFAANGDGTGDGTGGGKSIAFALDSSAPENGSTNVPLDTAITLTFNKNVVNLTVKENNMKCFALKDNAENNIAIQVEMGDDQIDPTVKRIITIRPKAKLSEGNTYTLNISKDLKAKNESSLEQDATVKFTCAGEVTKKPEEIKVEEPKTTTVETALNVEEPNKTTGNTEQKGEPKIATGETALNGEEPQTINGETTINGEDPNNEKTEAIEVAGPLRADEVKNGAALQWIIGFAVIAMVAILITVAMKKRK